MAAARCPRVVNGPLIKPREPGRFRDLGRLVVLGALLALPGFLYAGLQADLLHHRRDIVELEGRLRQLEEQRRRLQLELATLRDPKRIENLARTRSGLLPIRHDQVVYLTRPPEVTGQYPTYVAQVPGDADGRQRP